MLYRIMIDKAMKINDVLQSFGDNFNFNVIYVVSERTCEVPHNILINKYIN